MNVRARGRTQSTADEVSVAIWLGATAEFHDERITLTYPNGKVHQIVFARAERARWLYERSLELLDNILEFQAAAQHG